MIVLDPTDMMFLGFCCSSVFLQQLTAEEAAAVVCASLPLFAFISSSDSFLNGERLVAIQRVLATGCC